MSIRRPLVLVPLAGLLLLAGCGSGGSPSAGATATSSAAATSPEPEVALTQESQEAAADPARATDGTSGALAVALRAADLPKGWTVQANPVPDAADLSQNPSLAGICGASFPSESHRVAKLPVTGVDPKGTPSVVSEALRYDSPTSAASALEELRAAFAHCPAEDRTMVQAPAVPGLARDAVVAEYALAGGARQEVVAQARGALVSVLIGEDEGTVRSATRSIATRIAALPAAAIGL